MKILQNNQCFTVLDRKGYHEAIRNLKMSPSCSHNERGLTAGIPRLYVSSSVKKGWVVSYNHETSLAFTHSPNLLTEWVLSTTYLSMRCFTVVALPKLAATCNAVSLSSLPRLRSMLCSINTSTQSRYLGGEWVGKTGTHQEYRITDQRIRINAKTSNNQIK